MRRARRRDECGLAYRTRLKREEVPVGTNYRSTEEAVSCTDETCSEDKKNAGGSKWTIDICGDVESLELATTACERLRGLLFTDPDDITRLLIPCRDVHTFGMRYPLDIAFISRDGKVLEVHRNVSTMRRMRHRKASLVAERFSRTGEWLKKGDVIRIGTA